MLKRKSAMKTLLFKLKFKFHITHTHAHAHTELDKIFADTS